MAVKLNIIFVLIQELLKFDKKDLRAMLTMLKNDKLLKTKLCCVETEVMFK